MLEKNESESLNIEEVTAETQEEDQEKNEEEEEETTASPTPRIVPPTEKVVTVFSMEKLEEKLSKLPLDHSTSYEKLSCPSRRFESFFSFRGQTFS